MQLRQTQLFQRYTLANSCDYRYPDNMVRLAKWNAFRNQIIRQFSRVRVALLGRF
ncbi:Uncharacterised protein [Vibrio cholerae]|nr:Uncharacterised protein [Vibrio cholerae]